MLKKFFTVSIFLGVWVFSVSSAYSMEWIDNAWETLENEAEEVEGVLGLGAYYAPSPYIDVDDYVYPVPIAKLKYKGFFINGKTLGYTINNDQESEFKFSVIGEPRLMGYRDGDSSIFNGMENRDWSFDAGLRASWLNKLFDLDVDGITDTTNTHQGQEARAFVSKTFLEGFFTPRAGVIWQSKDLVDYYYGVLNNEATATRPAYKPDATMNYEVGATLAIPIGEKWAAIIDGKYQQLGSEIEDSPIVDDNKIFAAVCGLVYRF